MKKAYWKILWICLFFLLTFGFITSFSPNVFAESNIIEGVEGYTWYRGCTPTALSIIYNYHGKYEFPNLYCEPSSFHWDGPGGWIIDWLWTIPYCPKKLVDEFADIYGFPKSGGNENQYGAWPNDNDAVVRVAANHGYRFSFEYVGYDPSSGQTDWGDNRYQVFKQEIDQGRPLYIAYYSTLAGGNHSICGFGYDFDDTHEIKIYDTWDREPHVLNCDNETIYCWGRVIPMYLDILKPTQSAPVNASSKDNPNKINVEVTIVSHGLNKNDFNVQIGGKNARILSVVELSDKYLLEVMPPTQDTDGLYDLTVSVIKNNIVLPPDTEKDVILYSPEAANIDIVLVIDRSGSMGWYGYIDSAKNASKQFVDLMSNGDQVGVVSFSGNAGVDFPLTLINSSNIKEQAKSAIDSLYASGSTSVGDGLQTGQDQLTSNGISEHPWAMILLSDGYENTPAWVADVLPTIPEKTDIYTIALGSYSDEGLLQDIATETGGQYYFSPSSQELQEIYSLIEGQIAGQQTITLKSGTVNEGEKKIETVIIDFLISLARFLVSWPGSDIDLTLTDPNGLVIDSNVASTDPNISFVSGSTYEYYTIDSPNPGEWRMNIEGVNTLWGGENYTARVTGKSDLTLSTYFGKDRYETAQPITVLASLSDASEPITGASIEVVVQAPSQSLSAWKSINGDTIPTESLRESVSTLKYLYKESLNIRLSSQQPSSSPVFYLYDDGAHGDGQANDGVYGNLYTSTSNSGSYIFNFEVSGTTNTGDPFTRITQRSLFVAQATATGSISGTISYTGSQTGPVYIQAWQGDPTLYGNPDYLTSISSAGSYLLSNLPDGAYYLDSYMDSNENGVRDENEPRGVYGPPHMPNSVIVSGGSQTSDIDITLTEGIICYPNPCYLNRSQIVKIANLPSNSKVYIYTISGNLVRTLDDFMEVSTQGSSAIAIWDCKNDAGEEVARGVYIYFVSKATQKRTGKIAVIK